MKLDPSTRSYLPRLCKCTGYCQTYARTASFCSAHSLEDIPLLIPHHISAFSTFSRPAIPVNRLHSLGHRAVALQRKQQRLAFSYTALSQEIEHIFVSFQSLVHRLSLAQSCTHGIFTIGGSIDTHLAAWTVAITLRANVSCVGSLRIEEVEVEHSPWIYASDTRDMRL